MHLGASVSWENAMMKDNKAQTVARNKEALSGNSSAGWEENGEGSMDDDDDDVLAVSMMKFHSAQEAIQREVQKLKDVGKQDSYFLDDSIQPSNLDGCQSGEGSEPQGDLKSEPDEILKRRIETKVQYTVISSQVMQHSKSGYVDQIELMVQQENLALQHKEVMNKVESAESKARDLKRQADKLKLTCQQVLDREQLFKIQNRVCRLTCCFTIQLILFALVVFSSHHRNLVLVPT